MNEGDELQDVVKYLELEQQFSTKRSSICTPLYLSFILLIIRLITVINKSAPDFDV